MDDKHTYFVVNSILYLSNAFSKSVLGPNISLNLSKGKVSFQNGHTG